MVYYRYISTHERLAVLVQLELQRLVLRPWLEERWPVRR
jgi:hypothetical protein